MADQDDNTHRNKLKQWADDVVCPVCHAALRYEALTVICIGCGRTYPIVDGIPVLIPQRATEPTQSR